MIISEKESQEAFDYLHNQLIPKIQRHVDDTGHIWNGVFSTCHECLWCRQAYKNNKYLIYAHTREMSGIDFLDSTEIIDNEESFRDEFCRRLSD